MNQDKDDTRSNRLSQGYATDPIFVKLGEELEWESEFKENGWEDKYFDMLQGLKEMAVEDRVPKWQFILTKRLWNLIKEHGTKLSELANYKAENSPCLNDGESIGKANLTGYLRTRTILGETNESLRNMSIKALLLCSEFFDVSTDYLVGKTDLRKQRNIRVHTTLEKQREFWKKTDLQKQRSSWVKRGVGISEEALDTLRRHTNSGVLQFVDFLLCQPEIVETVKKIQYHVELSAIYREVFRSYSGEVRDLLLQAFGRYWETHVSPHDFRSYMLNIEDMLLGNEAYNLVQIVENGIGNGTRGKIENYVSSLESELQGEELLYRCLSLALAEETFELLEYKATQAEGMDSWNYDFSKMLERYIEEQIKSTLATREEQEESEQERGLYG